MTVGARQRGSTRRTGREIHVPQLMHRFAPTGLAALLAALDELRALEDTDLILKRAIELARDRIGLRRAGIFVFDRLRNLMLGTWGMDLSCSVVDEHHVIYDLAGTDLEALRRSEAEGAPFTRGEFDALLGLAQSGIGELLRAQRDALPS